MMYGLPTGGFFFSGYSRISLRPRRLQVNPHPLHLIPPYSPASLYSSYGGDTRDRRYGAARNLREAHAAGVPPHRPAARLCLYGSRQTYSLFTIHSYLASACRAPKEVKRLWEGLRGFWGCKGGDPQGRRSRTEVAQATPSLFTIHYSLLPRVSRSRPKGSESTLGESRGLPGFPVVNLFTTGVHGLGVSRVGPGFPENELVEFLGVRGGRPLRVARYASHGSSAAGVPRREQSERWGFPQGFPDVNKVSVGGSRRGSPTRTK